MRSEWFLALGTAASLVTWLVSAAARSRRGAESPNQPYDPDANRGPSGGDQVVGTECVICAKPFMFAKDATPCSDCDARVHEGCMAEHTRSHLPERPVYR